MQHLRSGGCTRASAKFQYPLRVEVGCNARKANRPCYLPQVSVPSTGRSGLQRAQTVFVRHNPDVSVPSTGRSGLQLCPNCSEPEEIDVSVPSTGRSGLQRNPNLTRLAFVYGFSTLYGSKWVATYARGSTGGKSDSFSTLYGSKWVATLRRKVFMG